MFAVVRTGGKQYCVKPGDVFKVEKLEVDQGESVDLSDVVLTTDDAGSIKVGQPVVAGANVKAKVLKHVKNDKIIVFKKHRRHNYRRKNGHRQQMTVLQVVSIDC